MARQPKTAAIVEAAHQLLAADHPMTLRQLFYQLVSQQVLDNTQNNYKNLSRLIATARQEKLIPWEWMEDRNRRPREVNMWAGLAAFADVAVHAYRRDVWASQPRQLEVWLEKDALSGHFEDVLSAYGVTLNVGRGYDGWDSIHNAAERWGTGESVTCLYFGDFDPSGDDMVRSLAERLAFFECEPEVLKVAINLDDINRYQLPPNPTKLTDSRRAAFVAKHGDVSVELDALPNAVLRSRLVAEVERRMDLRALERVRGAEKSERERLREMLAGAA